MSTFFVVARRSTPTNARLGPVLASTAGGSAPAPGDVALGRLDVLATLDGRARPVGARPARAARRDRAQPPAFLETAHDKLATAAALAAAGCRTRPPSTSRPGSTAGGRVPGRAEAALRSWGRDVVLCESSRELDATLARTLDFGGAGGVLQPLVPPCGYDLRIVVAGSLVVGAARRVAAPGEWRTNVGLGGRRVPTIPPAEAARLAVAAAEATGGDLVGVDLLPDGDGWTVLEVNGAVDFTGAYGLGGDVFTAAREALLDRARRARPAASAV
jgi:ribosomal protein S6--L-glutamate ligase